MAAGGEQTRSAHARDVSLGARIAYEQKLSIMMQKWNCIVLQING